LTQFELLVGAGAFWRRAQADFAAARRRLLVQAMTFEGDRTGLAVAAAIRTSPAQDRRVLVDDYSRHVVSDRFVHGPASWFDPAFRAEIRATHEMFRDLSAAHVGVRVTNPAGPLFLRYPARNHKKLIVADDAAYLGGVNFSDHNFAWRDFMLRIDAADAADRLAADFEATFAGAPTTWRADLPGITLLSLDGRTNRAGFAPVMDLIAGARTSVDVISPYLTFPVFEALAAARRRGAAVRLITPLANNKAAVRDYLLHAATRADFEVRLLPAMTHLKGLVIDGQTLVVGSSNFDFVSFAAEEELVAIIDSAEVAIGFERDVVAPALAEALPPGAWSPSAVAGVRSRLALKLVATVIAPARHARRGAVPWR
jgi:cardiolipin synthase